MNKEWDFSFSWNRSTCRSVVWPIYFPQLCKRIGNSSPRERSINSTCEWPFQIKVGLMWAEKLSKQWTPCITKSLRLWDQFLQEHLFLRLNIESFTKHNSRLSKARARTRWVTSVEWRCDMLWRGGAVTVTLEPLQPHSDYSHWSVIISLTLNMTDSKTLKCYFCSCQHDSFKWSPIEPLEVLYLRTVTLRSNCSDIQTWMIKEIFGMEQHLVLTNKGIKLHFCWQIDSMNLWTDTLIKNSMILKKNKYVENI